MPGNSTVEAIKILQLVKNDAKVNKRHLVIAYLDIEKAYDSVNPVSIEKSLQLLKFNKEYWEILNETFKKRSMRVITKAGYTKIFRPHTGLEQGDPSSPVLWNIFYEPLLRELNNLRGYQLGSINVSYLAYADDLTLIAENDYDLLILVNTVESYLTRHKMRIHPKKCTVQSNYDSTGIMIGDINAETGYKTNDKKEIVTYLGAPMPLIDSNRIYDSLIKEISSIVDKAVTKRISSRIASYIVQMIIYPILINRLCGRELTTQCQKKIESICLKLI